MDSKIQIIYNKNLALTALMGIIAALLLSFREGIFSLTPIYGVFIFIIVMFVVYFLTNYIFPDQDSALFILACFVAELGLIMLYRIDPEISQKQIIWFVLGVVLFVLSSLVAKHWVEIQVSPGYILAITAILLVLPLVLGVERWGSKSWIEFYGISFQPSELAKITFSLFLAKSLKDGEIENLIWFLLQCIIILGLLAAARDLGGAMLFYLTTLAMIFAATSRFDLTIFGFIGAGVASILGYYAFGHVRVRAKAWLNPWQDVPGKGYQIVQSLFAMAEGGFFGTGLGLGRPDYIPAVTTDFIFSAFFEEFGFLGAVAIIMVYFLLVYRGLRIALVTKNNFLSLSALGITTFMGFQIFTIIGGVTKLIPLTGVTLPFMSYGGSSMVMSFISLGILNGIWMRASGDEVNE